MSGQAAPRAWWRGYRPAWLRGDVIAGLTVWAVLVPESLAYASIAGVPPVVGLYAAAPALILYAAIGSSRHLIVGPMSATAALSASIVAVYASSDSGRYVALTTALALATGVVAIIAGLFRMGFLANFISAPVLKGFIVGLALTIIAGQLPKLFGVDKGEGDFFAEMASLIRQLGDLDRWTLGVGAVSLALVLGLKRWLPVVPGSLVAAAVGVLAVVTLGLEDKGVAIVGHIDAGLPSLGPPHGLDLGDYLELAGPAVGVVLIGFAEGLGAAKVYAARHGYDISPNRELTGLGAANLGSGLASGMVVNGSLSKTAVNGSAGARTQMSSVVVAVLTIVTLLFLTGLFEQLPEATLAAVVIAAVVELVDIGSLRGFFTVYTRRLGAIYGHAARADFAAAIAAMLGVLLFDTLPGLVIGIGISLLLLLYRSSRPNVAVIGRAGDAWVDTARHDGAETFPGVVVARVESGLFFANADHVRLRLRELAEGAHAVIVDAETMPFIDVTGAQMLAELGARLKADGVTLSIARDIGQVRDVLRRTDTDPAALSVYPTVREAVDAARR
ncbi:SulP family inorganic anion transporter [Phytomonospora sp. NPDC050363]|uniref:SulP family inorganic anion transporter n=1 Tax=Phytomonospora sp. NPDC050363 TaxID=3155642 RepID=UPI003403739B